LIRCPFRWPLLLGCVAALAAACGSRDGRYLKAQRALRDCQGRLVAEVTADWVRQGKAPEAMIRAWGPAGPQKCSPVAAIPKCEAFWDEVRSRSFAACRAEHEAVAEATRQLFPLGKSP
jgi:hypothetical protein